MKDSALKPAEEYSVEELFQQLEQITERLETDGVTLEESFELYKKGVSMVKSCGEKIDKIEKQMILLNEEEHE